MGREKDTRAAKRRTKKDFRAFGRAVAERLREERGGRSQAELADETRYTQQMISRYESGRVPPALWFLAHLEEAGLDTRYVLTGRRTRRLTGRQRKR